MQYVKNTLQIIVFGLLVSFNTSIAQSFTAETGYLYLGNTDLELRGGLEIKSGVIKKNDKIDIYAPTGRKFTATISKISYYDIDIKIQK